MWVNSGWITSLPFTTRLHLSNLRSRSNHFAIASDWFMHFRSIRYLSILITFTPILKATWARRPPSPSPRTSPITYPRSSTVSLLPGRPEYRPLGPLPHLDLPTWPSHHPTRPGHHPQLFAPVPPRVKTIPAQPQRIQQWKRPLTENVTGDGLLPECFRRSALGPDAGRWPLLPNLSPFFSPVLSPVFLRSLNLPFPASDPLDHESKKSLWIAILQITVKKNWYAWVFWLIINRRAWWLGLFDWLL